MSNEPPISPPPPAPGARQSPLHAWHIEHGGVVTEFAGWRMPLRYGSDLAEHHAVRSSAGVFDLCHMGLIEVRGPDAAEALDYGLVGNLSALDDGGARYTMLCEESGGIVDDLVVYRRGSGRFLVVANAANATAVFTALRERAQRFAGAEVVDQSDAYGLVAIQGPLSPLVLGRLAREPLAALRSYHATDTVVAGAEVMAARTGYTGEDGFELVIARDEARVVFEGLLEAGAGKVVPVGLAARDSLRLEAGMPLYGNELTREVTPYEAGLARVVRLDKRGDFVGRAALARRAESGAAIQLTGLLAEGRRAARHGYGVLERDTGAQVGTVTSGVLSPTLGRPIAMAYLTRDALGGERLLSVDVRGTRVPVEVGDLPFYKRARGGAAR